MQHESHERREAEQIIRERMLLLPGWQWTRDGLAEEIIQRECMTWPTFVRALGRLLSRGTIRFGEEIRLHGDSYKTYVLT